MNNIYNIVISKDMSSFRVSPEGGRGDSKGDIEINKGKPTGFIEFINLLLNSKERVKIHDENFLNILRNKLTAYRELETTTLNKITSYEKEYGFSYFPHQKNNIRKLCMLNSAILADEPGLGKSSTLLSLIESNHKTIILTNVVGKQILINEGKKFRPDLQLHCPKEFSIPKESNTGFIFTYNSLPPLSKECKDKTPMEEYFKSIDKDTFLIADEGHMVKAWKAQRTKRFRSLSKQILKKAGKVILATGSPVLKDPSDLWCLLQNLSLTNHTVGNWDNFCKLMGGRLEKNYKGKFFTIWDHNDIKEKEVKELLDPVLIRHTKEDVLKDLPDKIRSYLTVPIKKKSDNEVLNQYLKIIDKKEIDKNLKKNIFEIRQELSKDKTDFAIDFIKELLEENSEEPLVVFSAFLPSAKRVAKEFSWELITGDTSFEERAEIQDKFQRGEIKGISATILAGGTGLTLTQSSKAIFIDRDWSNLNLQAEDRIRRIGQKKICNYYYIISDHAVEDRITEILYRKEQTGLRTLKQSSDSEEPVTVITQIEKLLNGNKPSS